MKTMNLAQYNQMWQWINKWQIKNHTKDLPNYVSILNFKIEGVNKIWKKTYMDMYQRVQKWKNTHNGKMPQIIGIQGPATGTEPIPPTPGTVKTQLELGLGKFNTFTEFWQKIQGRGYKKYYNSKYTLKQEIQRLIQGKGLNCVDIMELCYSLAHEMDYQIRYIHVICKEGGHIRGQIKGHEFKNWTRIDPAAALSTHTKAPIGKVWCDYPNAYIDYGNWLRR